MEHIQALAQVGPGKNYRRTDAGYNLGQVIPGEWSSMVVLVPADFDALYSNLGVQIQTTGGVTIQMYVGSVSFND